jgi:hypothetical protein
VSLRRVYLLVGKGRLKAARGQLQWWLNLIGARGIAEMHPRGTAIGAKLWKSTTS